MGRGLSFEKQQNPLLSSLNRGCIKLSSLRKKTKRKWIALPLNSKLDNIRNIKNAIITFTSDIILTQCLLPSWSDLQPPGRWQWNNSEPTSRDQIAEAWNGRIISLDQRLGEPGVEFNTHRDFLQPTLVQWHMSAC
jgi:hypothetical protein